MTRSVIGKAARAITSRSVSIDSCPHGEASSARGLGKIREQIGQKAAAQDDRTLLRPNLTIQRI
jgi:hypothetical protein